MFIIAVLTAAACGYTAGLWHTRAKAEKDKEQLRAAAEQARLDAAKAMTNLESERRHNAENLRAQAEALRLEFKTVAADLVHTESRSIRAAHLNTLEEMLTPLGKDIAGFREQFLRGHADMARYIKDLLTQTAAVGKDAENLARALRANTKLQGNWGEAVLGNLLEVSGLTEGRDFTVQARSRDKEGRDLIPDVIVHLPGGREVIIDSKVSLVAYTDFAGTEQTAADEQTRLLKEHVASVKRHIKELSAKSYDKAVQGSIGYVLMFIPSEAAYVAAVSADTQLAAEAYARRVILVNPANLLMALQLAYNLWQSELQSRSVNDIYASAERLYKKFCLFAKNFVQIGQSVQQLAAVYDHAEKQLATGKGNIISQLEGWKKKGLTPSADIPKALTEEGCENGKEKAISTDT